MDETSAELLDAVRAEAPDDDAATLVYADWLSERGDPRGEYVALACRAERLPPDDPQRRALVARLARIDASPWVRPLASLGLDPPIFERGFVRRAQLVGRSVANVGKLLRREPVTRLAITSGGRRLLEVAAAAPELSYLRSLSLLGQHRKGLERILCSPYLANLDDLHVAVMSSVIQGVLGQIVARPRAVAMELADEDIAALPRGFWQRTSAAELGGRHLTDAGIARLAGAPLERLSLCGASVTGRGLAALGARLGELRVLELSRCKLDRSAVDVLASAGMSRLEELGLGSIAGEGIVDAILEAGIADRVASLDVCHAKYTHGVLLALLARNPRLCPEQRGLDSLTNDELSDRCPGLTLVPEDDR